MLIEIVEGAHSAVRIGVRLHLLQIPRRQVHIAVCTAICAGCAIVGRRVEVGAPAPVARAERCSARVSRLDRSSRRGALGRQLVVRQRCRVHIPMRRVPQHRFVVQLIDPDATVGGGPEGADEVRHHTAGEGGARGNARVARHSTCEVDASRLAVPAVGVPEIETILRREARPWIATREGMGAGGILRHVTDHGNGDDGGRATRPVARDKGVDRVC